jgi:hypothetical protein
VQWKELLMSRLTVASSTQALLRLVDGPGLLSKRVRIGKYIVDAVIIDAHPTVARWYGYESPSAMQGRYLSELHDPRGLALVRQYAVARKLGLPGVPDEYDIQITLPNGTRRWLRKQQVRQITEGGEVYWVSHSIPITDAQARPLPQVTLPLSTVELERYLGRYTVGDVESLIERASLPFTSLFNNTTIKGTKPQLEIPVALQLAERVPSVEIPLGNVLYRRWIHTCSRCQRRWVAEKAAPKKCLHYKSPYWNVPRERRRGKGR